MFVAKTRNKLLAMEGRKQDQPLEMMVSLSRLPNESEKISHREGEDTNVKRHAQQHLGTVFSEFAEVERTQPGTRRILNICKMQVPKKAVFIARLFVPSFKA